MTDRNIPRAWRTFLRVALLPLVLAGCTSSPGYQALGDTKELVNPPRNDAHLYAFLDHGRGGFERFR
jgi:hypothetical protein